MKIRIGIGAAGAAATPETLGELVSAIDELGFDSLWLSEVLTGPVIDPLVGLAWAAASNPRVKLGTTALLPGRNVLRLAKQLASLDVLCRGRLLVTLVPGLTYAPERDAIGVEPKRRGAVIDDALPLLRRLWAGETVSHDGAAGSFRDVKLSPLPVQQPLEVWLGGNAPAALERCGRLSDGWLPSLLTPEEAAAGRGRGRPSDLSRRDERIAHDSRDRSRAVPRGPARRLRYDGQGNRARAAGHRLLRHRESRRPSNLDRPHVRRGRSLSRATDGR